ncbi:MAG TPA: deoxyribonuclease IV [Bryobacteraceae bacterium]|nr:deoxyribonuclease IV [Bryobacteraceae bacterium]
MRLGIHTSIAGSLEKAAFKAAELGANTFQIFSASPRMWRAVAPSPVQVQLLQRARRKHDLYPLVIHDSYLINLASCDEALRAKSALAFRGEIERAIAIGAEYLVAHPGNHKGHSLEAGLHAVVRSLTEAAAGLDTRPLTVLLENTVGSANQIGSRLAELAVLREFTARESPLRIGFCIDTCHCLGAGYDVGSAEGLRATIDEIDRLLGLGDVPVVHANDSKGQLGSHLDRHANIGEGYIGEEGFRRILTHPKLRAKAFILETPVDHEGDDLRNVESLKRLCRKSSMTTTRSS